MARAQRAKSPIHSHQLDHLTDFTKEVQQALEELRAEYDRRGNGMSESEYPCRIFRRVGAYGGLMFLKGVPGVDSVTGYRFGITRGASAMARSSSAPKMW